VAGGPPETPRTADTHPDTGEGATIATWCPPFEWRDLESELASAPPASSPAQPPTAPAQVPAGGDTPWADRRLADRVPVRRGSRAEIRRWGGGVGGQDIAEELINVSDAGVGVRLSTPVRRGERFDVTLWGPGAEWCGRGMGVVRWAVVFGGGTVLAGLQLNRPLTAQAILELTAESVPPKSTCPREAPSRR